MKGWRAFLLGFSCAAFGAALGPGGVAAEATTGEKTPLAVVHGETLYVEDIEGALALRLFQLEVDRYALLKAAAEKHIDAQIIAREAVKRGISPETLEAELEGEAAAVPDEEVDAYLAKNPARPGTDPEQARLRVRHYLGERDRLARRVEILSELRERAGSRILLEAPEPPRTDIDIQGAPARGEPGAPVQIVHFASLGSRNSIRSARKIEKLRETFPKKLRTIHRNYLNDRDEAGLHAARLGFAAQEAGRFWDYYDRLIENENPLAIPEIEAAAKAAGLSVTRIRESLESEGTLRVVKKEMEVGVSSGVLREPSLFVNGRFISGLLPYDEIEKIVIEELDRAQNHPR